MLPSHIHLTLPAWIHDIADTSKRYPGNEEKMTLAIALAQQNITQCDGGPFGAAVFDEQHRLIAAACNRVVPQHCSIAHAEILACMLAQQHLGRCRLNAEGRRYTLATSAQPCCQCYGAIIWAGIDTLLIGARKEDVETLSHFDEGPLPEDWIRKLERYAISLQRDILREQACTVLAAYGRQGTAY